MNRMNDRIFSRMPARGLLLSLAAVAVLLLTVSPSAIGRDDPAGQVADDDLKALQAQLSDLHAMSRTFKLVARVAKPGVVYIEVSGGQREATDGELDDHIRDELRDIVPEEQLERWLRRVPPGSGSGIILDKEGFILTNHHVVEGRPDITVTLHDERQYPGTLVGTDPKTDLAVVRINAERLQPLTLGDSDALEVGDWVLAVGSPFGLTQTVTHGIVSAKGRTRVPGIAIDYQNFIQTDAAINPGNSGGPLLNLRGEVVGINTAIATHGDSYNAGIAFTIPSNMARKIAHQLKTNGEVQRGWLGISFTPVSREDVDLFDLPSDRGVFVERVLEGSPAAESGVRVEDVIVAVNGDIIHSSDHLRGMIAEIQPHETASLRVIRGARSVEIAVKLGLQPESLRRARVAPAVDYCVIEPIGLRARTLRPGMLRTYDETERGVIILGFDNVLRDAPEVEAGELIVMCNRETVRTVHQLRDVLDDVKPGDRVRLQILEPTGDRRLITIRVPNE